MLLGLELGMEGIEEEVIGIVDEKKGIELV